MPTININESRHTAEILKASLKNTKARLKKRKTSMRINHSSQILKPGNFFAPFCHSFFFRLAIFFNCRNMAEWKSVVVICSRYTATTVPRSTPYVWVVEVCVVGTLWVVPEMQTNELKNAAATFSTIWHCRKLINAGMGRVWGGSRGVRRPVSTKSAVSSIF